MGRGFHRSVDSGDQGANAYAYANGSNATAIAAGKEHLNSSSDEQSVGPSAASSKRRGSPEAASYLSVLLERKTLILCLTGFFFQ